MACILFSTWFSEALPAGYGAEDARPEKTLKIRVGVMSYQTGGNPEDDYSRLFSNLAHARWSDGPKATEPHRPAPVQFSLSVGSYEQIVNWFESGEIDLAVASPGLLAEIDRRGVTYEPLGLRVKGPVKPPYGWVDSSRRTGNHQTSYRSVCLTRRGSPINDEADLLRAIKAKQVRFLFVDPLSTSGRLLPIRVLRDLLEVPPEECNKLLAASSYTFSHSTSLERLALEEISRKENMGEGAPELVAFITDTTTEDLEIKGNRLDSYVKQVKLRKLDDMKIGENVLIARAGGGSGVSRQDVARRSRIIKVVRKAFAAAKDAKVDKLSVGYEELPPRDKSFRRGVGRTEWDDTYAVVRNALAEAPAIDDARDPPDGCGGEMALTLEEVGWLMVQYSRMWRDEKVARPLRIALVLSGGGAKCAYQVGVIEAIEKMFERLRCDVGRLDPELAPSLDVSLVVGTSGGAINALPVALGTTREEDGRNKIRELWTGLDQRDLIRPSATIRLLAGAWFGALQLGLLLLIVWLVRVRYPVSGGLGTADGLPTGVRRVSVLPQVQSLSAKVQVSLGLFIAGAIEIVFSQGRLKLEWFGFLLAPEQEHVAHHIWSFITMGLYWSAVVITATGVVLLVFWGLARFERLRPRLQRRQWQLGLTAFLGALAWQFSWWAATPDDSAGYLNAGLELSIWRTLLLSVVSLLIGALLGMGAMLAWQVNLNWTGDPWKTSRRAILAALCILPGALAIDWLLIESTVFSQAKLEGTVAGNYSSLIAGAASKEGDAKHRLKLLSWTVLQGTGGPLDKGRLARDLVITGSRLDAKQGDRENDLYFYHDTGKSSPPMFHTGQGRRFKDLPHSLFDVIIGSGSIYPFFPSHLLSDTLDEEQVHLIDGGFAHNSPVEAAVEWGATHILVVEASPDAPLPQGNLLTNAGTMINYLHAQAQLTDTRSREQVIVFTIRPDPDTFNLDIFDFAGDLVGAAIEKGNREAGDGGYGTGRPRFRMSWGQPQYWVIAD
jgi:predicted acylesterase/phospholipase RssA/ABC-type phosphate/phosphonate transport system substrate-binding protein